FFFQAEDGIRDGHVTGVQTCALPIYVRSTTATHGQDGAPSRPCVAVVDLTSNTQSCVEVLKGRTTTSFEAGYHFVKGTNFINGDKRRVAVTFTSHEDQSTHTTEYQQSSDGMWNAVARTRG